ncbi:Integrin beta-like protein 1 [Varanus komodoensis]|nr:Integrin beta-like protein 1 [Varanus komodoensis]
MAFSSSAGLQAGPALEQLGMLDWRACWAGHGSTEESRSECQAAYLDSVQSIDVNKILSFMIRSKLFSLFVDVEENGFKNMYKAGHSSLTNLGHGKCDCGKCKCEEGWFGDACQYPVTCNLTRKKSNEMCKNSQDIICSNAGTCHCGRCKCDNLEGNGLIHGKYCECDDRECIDEETGEMCTGHGKCYCGNCYCEAGWHGDKCELQCDITPWEIKKKCTSPDGKICSNRGTCVCGECTCHDVDPTGDWGDIHGDTCECDERNCKALYDRYSDDFCSGHGQCNCGTCACKAGWTGKKCEHPLSCPMTAEESARKCQGSAPLPCSGRGRWLILIF